MSGGLENMHLENVCRLCLTDASEAGDMLPIFPVRGGNPHSPTSVVNRILQCTSLRLEQTEGVPATICELCSVRLEDWHAFREQCIGSDEYLRVTLRHAFYPEEGQTSHATSSTNAAIPVLQPNGGSKTGPTYTDGLATKSTPIGRTVSTTPPPSVSSRLSLAKRRQSTFEMPISDGKGNATDQKILVEVLGVCKDTEAKRPSVPTYEGINGHEQEKPNGFPSQDHTMLEQASWSREYCARINNLMVKVVGPRPFKCKVCRRMFNNRTNMRRHIKVLHSDEVFEGESPPPECYGYSEQLGGLDQSEKEPPVKKKRKSTDPPIVGPYKCEVCPRSFKMPAHLAVHRKTHRQIEFDQSELSRAIEQQKRQMQHQQRERSSSAVSSEVDRTRKVATTVEPCDVIQLSDDDEEEDPMGKALQRTTFGTGDDLDDGFDEEEGSLKELSSLDADLQPDPSSLAIVEIGAEDNDGTEQLVPKPKHEEEDEDVMVIQDVETIVPASKPKPSGGPSSSRAPPGPLSSKMKYNNQTINSSVTSSAKQKPLIAPRPLEDLQQKQSSSHTTSAGPASKQKPATAGGSPTIEQQPSSSASASASASATTVHRCHLCRQTFPREDLLRDHQKSHQNDSPCAYRCGWCKKGFRYRQNYTLHLEKQTCRLINADPVRTLQQQQQAGKCT